MEAINDPNPIHIHDSELELYTIPSQSRWFLWDEIHETERIALKEFFDGSSISRTPKIYKEYRDFIINKYREEPSRRLTFTEVRKSLVGDVTLLRKVFLFLEKWGLIDYGAPPSVSDDNSVMEDEERCKVKVEEGAPNGIRVVATPNSLKPISVPRKAKTSGDTGGNGFKFPPLASYSDVYNNVIKQKELTCRVCNDKCDSGQYKSTQDDFIICAKCFKKGDCGENRSIDEFKLMESNENSSKLGAVWTEGETLLLLESVLKHGDDWELVAQNVQTKTKLDCISKLIELPFGELILGSAQRNGNSNSGNSAVNNAQQLQSSLSDHKETSKTEDQLPEHKNENEQNGDIEKQGPPSKRQRVASLSDSSSSLMEQVGLLSTVVGPQITAAAADAAVMALCDENLCPREIFDVEEDHVSDESYLNSRNSCSERVTKGEGSEMEVSTQSEMIGRSPKEDEIPLMLRIRAAVGTALGAVAARAKLLADQEDREIEHLVATIIEAQVNKLQHKVKHFEDLEMMMEMEHAEMEELKESLLSERIDVLQRTFNAGMSRWKDYPSVKP